MACEYCGAVGRKDHPAGCPNAPHWEEPKRYCSECGTELDERADKPFHGLCMECFKALFEQQVALAFIRANSDRMTNFFEYDGDITYRKHPMRLQINEFLWRNFIANELGGMDADKKYALDKLKDFCFEVEIIEDFADFMHAEGWL